MNLNIASVDGRPVDRLAVEVVEHKGLGHPDSICDSLAEAACVLVSQIGRPIDDPQIVDLRLRTVDGSPVEELTAQVEEIVRAELEGVGRLADALLDGTVAPDRWPLRSLSTRQPAS